MSFTIGETEIEAIYLKTSDEGRVLLGTVEVWTAGAAAPPPPPPSAEHLSGVKYSITGTLWPGDNAPTYEGMNNGSADASTNNAETGTNNDGGAVTADCGAVKHIDHIVIGYDYLNNLPTGWGVTFTENLNVEGSTNNTDWTSITTTPTYASSGSSDGLVSIPIDGDYRYIRIKSATDYYICLLEFQIWGY